MNELEEKNVEKDFIVSRHFSRRNTLKIGAGMAAAGFAPPALAETFGSDRPKPDQPKRALVLGHRGACAHRPEHTLGSYERAIADGADFIEPDLVVTKDGVLVVRHENNLIETTDVREKREFADRYATKWIDSKEVKGWFTEDFTFKELKTLRAKERLGAERPESQSFDGKYPIMSFDEIVDFLASQAAARGRPVGLIPELKHSTYFAKIDLPLEDRFLDIIHRIQRLPNTIPVIVQSTEIANLQRLHKLLERDPNIQLMQLTEGPEIPADRLAEGDMRTWCERLTTPQGLEDIAEYADYIAPEKRDLIPLGLDGRLIRPKELIERSHKAKLKVCTWTFRPENHNLPRDFRNTAGDYMRNPAGSVAEIKRYIEAGVDAFFTDDPALGRRAVDG
jgi:glycerophosphoryl diester phosphodiesterase